MRFAVMLGAVLAALVASSASATVRIVADSGGQIGPYLENLATLRNSGERVVIDGPCLSACTMVLGLVPRNQICATHNAVLGFHAAWMYDKSGSRVASASGTRELMKTYPAAVRAWSSPSLRQR